MITTLYSPIRTAATWAVQFQGWEFGERTEHLHGATPAVPTRPLRELDQLPTLFETPWTGIAISSPLAQKRYVLLAKVDTKESARSMLTDRMRVLLDQLCPLLGRAARIYGVQSLKIVVSGFIDPEEDRAQIVVTQWVNLPTDAAFHYWEKLGALIDDWMRLLPDTFKPVAERIGVDIEWNVTGGSDDLILRTA